MNRVWPIAALSALLLGTLSAGVSAAQPEAAAGPLFREVAGEWGLDFRHHHGGSGERYMVETMVGGVALFDYDGDGDDDALFVDGGVLPGYQGEAPRTVLLRNDLIVGDDGVLEPRFVDVSAAAGIDFAGYGCGATAGDFDGDGWIDVYLTAYGANALFRNRGDGSFEEVGAGAGVADPRWSASAAFADTDLDGDLDLYVANYVEWSPETRQFCGNRETGVRGYCHPGVYQGSPDAFYRNRGDGSFEDATAEVGLAGPRESGLGVVFGDVDANGWPDLYVANDLDPNLLFLGVGEGRFEDNTLLSGTAASPNGHPEAGMGVELADLNGDLRPDLVVTNFALETNALYRNSGGGLFVDRRFADNLAEPTLHPLGFGVAALDADLDGDLDLLFANGHILDNLEELGQDGQYRQPNLLLLNQDGRFSPAPQAGLDVVRASRGLAIGDLDLDGDLDVVIVNSNDVAEAYEGLARGSGGGLSRGGSGGSWLLVDLEQPGANRYALGAEAVLRTGGSGPGAAQLRHRRSASSYLSQNGLGLHFGIPASAATSSGGDGYSVAVRWPDGGRLRLEAAPQQRRLLVRRP